NKNIEPYIDLIVYKQKHNQICGDNQMDSETNHVVIEAHVLRYNHNRKLVGYSVISAPPHVIYHVTDHYFQDIKIIQTLIEYGYSIEITIKFEDTSLLGFCEYLEKYANEITFSRSNSNRA
ncbi:MAG: hypothetical protein AB1489_43690, partial [Acidobacteriota bacterium]